MLVDRRLVGEVGERKRRAISRLAKKLAVDAASGTIDLVFRDPPERHQLEVNQTLAQIDRTTCSIDQAKRTRDHRLLLGTVLCGIGIPSMVAATTPLIVVWLCILMMLSGTSFVVYALFFDEARLRELEAEQLRLKSFERSLRANAPLLALPAAQEHSNGK